MSLSPPNSSEQPLPMWTSAAVSICFWLMLGAAAALFTLLVLAPRVVVWEDLALRHQLLLREQRELSQQIERLETIAFALEHDPAFISRAALAELEAVECDSPLRATDDPQASSSVNSASGILATTPPEFPGPWYLPAVRSAAAPGIFRNRLIGVSVGFCLFAFVCLQDQFFAGGLGRHLRNASQWLTRRYARQSGKPWT